MNFEALMEQRAAQLVGKRLSRVRYYMMTSMEWTDYAPRLDTDIESVLLDFGPGEVSVITWSAECGLCYGLTLQHGPLPAYEEPEEYFHSPDVTEVSGWQAVAGERIVEARWLWDTVVTHSIPNPAVTRMGEGVSLDLSQAIPRSATRVPQDLTLFFESGRWVVLCAARYYPDDGLLGLMDKMLVVHDEAIAQRFQMGPYTPPPLLRGEG